MPVTIHPLKPQLAPKPDTSPRGSRLPDDWQPSPADRAFADMAGFAPAEIDRIAAQFADYWHAAAGGRARKASWPATWRVWIRRETEFRARRGVPRGLTTGMAAALRYGGRP